MGSLQFCHIERRFKHTHIGILGNLFQDPREIGFDHTVYDRSSALLYRGGIMLRSSSAAQTVGGCQNADFEIEDLDQKSNSWVDHQRKVDDKPDIAVCVILGAPHHRSYAHMVKPLDVERAVV